MPAKPLALLAFLAMMLALPMALPLSSAVPPFPSVFPAEAQAAPADPLAGVSEARRTPVVVATAKASPAVVICSTDEKSYFEMSCFTISRSIVGGAQNVVI